MSIISVKGLTKYYGKNRGIVNVSFNVEKGSIFGFIGDLLKAKGVIRTN